MTGEDRNEGRAIEAAMSALAEGRLDGLQAEDRDVGALVRISEKDRDRYLVMTGNGIATAREEWRSGGWIRRMLDRGRWLLLPPPAPEPTAEDRRPDPPSPGGSAEGLRLRVSLRGGHVEVALPPDATAEEMRLARGELDRFSGILALLADSRGS